MENRCNILTFISVVYSFFICFRSETIAVNEACLLGLLLLESLFVIIFTHRNDGFRDQSKYRPLVDPNLMCVFLVPICLLNELLSLKSRSNSVLFDDVHLSFGVTAVIITKYFFLLDQHKIPALIAHLISLVYLLTFAHNYVIILYCVSALLIWKNLDWIPKIAPKSFSFAEMSVCLQLGLVVLGRMCRHLLEAEVVLEDEQRLKWTGATAVIAILVATATCRALKAFQSVLSFLCVYAVFALLSLAFLIWCFKENLFWIFHLILRDNTVIILLLSWVCLSGVTVIWTVVRALQSSSSGQKTLSDKSQNLSVIQDEPATISESCKLRKTDFMSDRNAGEGDCNATRSGVSLNTRKVFHLLILLVYIPGLILAPHILFFASSLAFGAFVIVEAVRVFEVPGVGHHLDNILRTFVDERDQGVLFLTHFYLLVGLSLPLWLTYSTLSGAVAPIKLYSGVLSLGIGDTVACVAGKAFGTIRWKGSIKTFEGTLSSVIAQLGFIYIFSCFGFLPEFSYICVTFGVIHGSLYEAFTDQIDNLVLPLALFPFLCAA